VTDAPPRFGEESIVVTDPSGLVIELIANDADSRRPWTSGGVDPASAVRGLHSVSLDGRDPRRTVDFMREMLGFEVVDEMEGRIRVAVNGDGPGKQDGHRPGQRCRWARNGLGTVHHVAMAIGSDDDQLKVREELVGACARDRRSRPPVFQVDLLSRAGRSPLRDRHDATGLSSRRAGSRARARAQAAAVGGAAPVRDRSAAA
jgi:catechol 2,3-dioxygenase-like lactoylglutathione lyase family enzyme